MTGAEDPRFTRGLIYDIHQVLEQHGYKPPEPGPDGSKSRMHRALGSVFANVRRLVRDFEGVDDEAEGGARG